MYLVYFCTNNFLFANQWTEERKEHIYKIFLSNQKFYDLYIRLSHKYGKFLEQSHIFKTILIYFLKIIFSITMPNSKSASIYRYYTYYNLHHQ